MRLSPDEYNDMMHEVYQSMLADYEDFTAKYPDFPFHMHKPKPSAPYIPTPYGHNRPSTSRRGEKRRTRKERFGGL